LQGYLDGRLRYALRRRSDAQAISGNGTPPNLRGLANRTGILTYSAPGSEAVYASVRNAIAHGEANEAVYEIAVVNPADAATFDLSNASSAGLHAVPN